MQEDYSRIVDELYSISRTTKLTFSTNVNWYDTKGRFQSFHNEYKTKQQKQVSVVTKRKIYWFLALEYNDSSTNTRESIQFFPEDIENLKVQLSFIYNNWLRLNSGYGLFTYIEGRIKILRPSECCQIKTVRGGLLEVVPTVEHRENFGDVPAIIMSIGSKSISTLVTMEKLSGILCILNSTNWVTSAQVMLNSVYSRGDSPYNRVDLSPGANRITTPPASGKVGRDFKFRQNRKGIL